MKPAGSPISSIDEITPIGRHQKEVEHQMTSYGRPTPTLPCGDLLENRDDYHKICVPLFKASITGDWEAAQHILSEHQPLDLLGFGITEKYDTALHIAASANRTKSMQNFVKKLVDTMSKEQLELQNKNYNTALCLAAMAGNIQIVEIIVQKNPALLDIPGSQGMMPLYMASLHEQYEMVHFLYKKSNKMTGDVWTDQNRGCVLEACVEAALFDIALDILTDHPKLPVNGKLLGVLAPKRGSFEAIKRSSFWRAVRLSFAFIGVKVEFPAKSSDDAVKLLQIIWKNILKFPKNTIDDILKGPADVIVKDDGNQQPKHSSQILFVAAENGNVKFLVELLREYPDLMWKTNDNNQTIFHVAVAHRHERIYCLLSDIGSMSTMIASLIDNDGNNILHLAGKCPKTDPLRGYSGVIQMHREILWFREIASTVPRSCHVKKNKADRTPYDLFMEEHRSLSSTSEKVIKETANQCIVAAALIITISFAAAYTVPGGYDQASGIPIFIHNGYFRVFTISNSISLTLSCISILVFLSIFVLAGSDFLLSLYARLMAGLAILFLAISAMLVAFGVSFFLLYQHKLIWVPVTMVVLSSIPIILYIRSPYDLLLDAYRSRFWTGYLFRPKHPLLFYKNPRF